jgi:hypothetical protein
VGFAMMEIEIVSVDRAKELGPEVRANAAGPDAVRVELEFEPKGALKDYNRVDLEIRGSSGATGPRLEGGRSRRRRAAILSQRTLRGFQP